MSKEFTLVFNGSPKKGVSYNICKTILNKYASVEVINAYDIAARPCIDCNYCVKNPLKCIYRDLDELYQKIMLASTIIIVSPVHVGGVSSPLHAIFSRMQVFFNYKFVLKKQFDFKKKHGFAISVSGSDWNGQEDSLNTIFKHALAEMNCHYLKHMYLTNTDTTTTYGTKLEEFYLEVDKYATRKNKVENL